MENKVPDIRFDGYDEEWQPKKFSEFAHRVGQTTYDASIPSVEFEDINSKRGTLNKNIFAKDIHKTGLSFEIADVLYGKLRPYLGNVLLADFKGIAVGDFWVLRANDVTPSFLYQFVLSETFGKIANISRGSKMPRASWENINQSAFKIPSYNESNDIAKMLSSIDSLITKQEGVIGKLKILKTSFLQVLFPQGLEKRPRLRLDGFTDDWQEKTLSEIVAPYKEIVSTPKNGYERLGIRSHGKGTFHSFIPKGAELESAQMSIVRANNLIVNITFGWELAVAITQDEDEGKLVSHRFPQFSFNEDYISLFFRFCLINENLRKHLVLASPGSAGRNRVLKIDKMLEYKLLVPKKDEQQAIADLLTEYDSLIRLNEQKLEKLRNVKQALLDKMFV